MELSLLYARAENSAPRIFRGEDEGVLSYCETQEWNNRAGHMTGKVGDSTKMSVNNPESKY